MKSTFQLQGLDGYLDALANAEQDVDIVVREVLTDAAPEAAQLMEDNLRRTSEEWTGAAASTLFTSEIQQDGNYIFFELGADISRDPATLYKEYGRTRQAAEPFLRPSLTKLRQSKIKAMLKEVLDRFGVSTT